MSLYFLLINPVTVMKWDTLSPHNNISHQRIYMNPGGATGKNGASIPFTFYVSSDKKTKLQSWFCILGRRCWRRKHNAGSELFFCIPVQGLTARLGITNLWFYQTVILRRIPINAESLSIAVENRRENRPIFSRWFHRTNRCNVTKFPLRAAQIQRFQLLLLLGP